MQTDLQNDSRLDRKRRELERRRDAVLSTFSRAARMNKPFRMRAAYCRIREMNELLETLDLVEAEARARPKSATHQYSVSSWFLHECFKKLTADENEQFFFITGSEIDGVLVLDQVIEFDHESRTPGGVKAKHTSTHKLLIRLSQFGHRLLGHFHSHPGLGLHATRPSTTDNEFQQRLESGGHVAVAAIFSRDGYVRFFRLDRQVEIEIHGTGVEKVDDHIFRLRNLDSD